MNEGNTDHLVFMGDAYLPETYPSVVQDVEGVVFNLEHPITAHNIPAPNKVVLRAEEEHVTPTFQGTPRAVCLANNHVMDYGERGLNDTLDILKGLGIGCFGAGRLSDNCGNPLIMEVDKTVVALSGYVCRTSHPVYAEADRPGVAPVDLERISEDIRIARGEGALRVVVSLHWGVEEVFLPRPADVDMARRIIELGVDLIIGHHAHRIQPFHKVGCGHVFYGLGNLFMPDIDLPSHFDKRGRATDRFIKKQAYWNRSSLAVCYRPLDGSVNVRTLSFDGRCVKPLEGGISRGLELDTGGPLSYETRFRLSSLYGGLTARAWSFYNNPRLPASLRGRRR